uniref:Pecanex-like protein n=1 Tax=Hydatigena taeniaeformis TaxID=6205 RepID=A0A0R3WVL6_HYDTA
LRYLYRLLVVWIDNMIVKGAHKNPKIPFSLEDSLLAMRRSSQQDLATSSVFSPSRASTHINRVVFGETNGSNSSLGATGSDDEEEGDAGVETGSPRAVTVLYRYFSEELSRLLMGKTAPRAEQSMGSRKQELPFF